MPNPNLCPSPMNLLINLPPSFFTQPELLDRWADLESRFTVRKTSHNTPDEIAADLAWAEVVLMWSWPVLDEALLARAGSLKYVGHIDINLTGARCELAAGIPISSSRAGFSPAVAEMALGLILNGLRRISDHHAAMRAGNESWVASFPSDIPPLERELSGARVGIVGLGKVGRRLAELLQPFHVDLKVVDPYVSDEVIASFGGQRREIDEAVSEVDILVLCAANNDGTRRLLNAERIARMPANALLVNVARADIVDYAALAARLQKGDLLAALDVFEQEPLAADSPLRDLPNTFLTPHRAGGLIASVQRNIDWLITDLKNVLAGQPRQFAVTETMIPGLDRT